MKRLRLLLLMALGAVSAAPPPAYRPAAPIPLGAPDRWDYAVMDPGSGRLYVAHGDRLTVVDGRAGRIVGDVMGIAGGTHGTAISTATNQGFTDDGRGGIAIAFDLETLKITHTIPVADDADGIAIDKATGHVFVVEGDPGTISVINPAKDAVIATIQVGEKMEYPAADGRGTIYVAGEEKGDFLKVDAGSDAVTARWPLRNCTSPHGLALDVPGRRAFVGCANAVMMVADIDSGRVVAQLPIGRGNDAVAYDAVRRRVFSSNGVDGTVSVYQQVSPDDYRPLPPIPTKVSGRTMAVDPSTGRLFVVAADTDPSPTPGGRPKARPGTLKLLVFDPVG